MTTTLATVVTFERSIPIPVLNSQAYINEAVRIVNDNGSKLNEENKNQVLVLLNMAQQELEVAEELGYGKRNSEFAHIHEDINVIEERVKKNEKSKGLFENLRIRLEKFKNKISN